MLKNSYDGLSQNKIESMSREELTAAVMRMFSVNAEADLKDFYGKGLLADILADAFRDRLPIDQYPKGFEYSDKSI